MPPTGTGFGAANTLTGVLLQAKPKHCSGPVVVSTPSWPSLFLPQHFTPPPVVRAHVCSKNVEMVATPLVSPVTSTGGRSPGPPRRYCQAPATPGAWLVMASRCVRAYPCAHSGRRGLRKGARVLPARGARVSPRQPLRSTPSDLAPTVSPLRLRPAELLLLLTCNHLPRI
jgi:hypothetical protein